MRKFREQINEPFYKSAPFTLYFSNSRIAVLDIETTGLSPDSSRAILCGLLVPYKNKVQERQYFSASAREESQMLEAYLSDLSEADLLISFNGNRFDLPFLRRRNTALGLNRFPEAFSSLDLYRCCRFYSSLPQILPNLKQKTVEEFLGFSEGRTDEISGGESVILYREYQKTQNHELLNLILLHNRDDLVQLSRLLLILNKLDLHRILFYEGFPEVRENRAFYTRSIEFRESVLRVSAAARNCPMDYYSFESGYQAAYRASQKQLILEIPCFEKASFLFVDLEALPIEAQQLEDYPGYQSGYLILRKGKEIQYAETNLFLKSVLNAILQKL